MDTSDCYDASADARDAARLRQIMDGAVEHAIIEMDLDRRVRGWNAGAERLFGLSAAAALGQSADVIFTAEDRATLVSAREAAQVLRTGRAEGTLYYLRGDGSQFWASSVTTPLRKGPSGFEPVSWDDALTDIAARLTRIVHRDGAGAVGWYMGNPGAFSYAHTFAALLFIKGIGRGGHYFTAS